MEQAQQQHNPFPLDDVQNFFLKRSVSQATELERLGTVKTEDCSSQTPARLPFTPVPKVDQLPTMPSIPPTSVQQLNSFPTSGSQVRGGSVRWCTNSA